MSEQDERLHALSAKRWRFAIILSVCMLVLYFSFIMLVAFDKPLLATVLTPGLTLGIVLGASVIVGAWVLTMVYVTWANGPYDNEIKKIRES